MRLESQNQKEKKMKDNEFSGVDLAKSIQDRRAQIESCNHVYIHRTKTYIDYAAYDRIKEWDECEKCGKKMNTTDKRIENLTENEIMR